MKKMKKFDEKKWKMKKMMKNVFLMMKMKKMRKNDQQRQLLHNHVNFGTPTNRRILQSPEKLALPPWCGTLCETSHSAVLNVQHAARPKCYRFNQVLWHRHHGLEESVGQSKRHKHLSRHLPRHTLSLRRTTT